MSGAPHPPAPVGAESAAQGLLWLGVGLAAVTQFGRLMVSSIRPVGDLTCEGNCPLVPSSPAPQDTRDLLALVIVFAGIIAVGIWLALRQHSDTDDGSVLTGAAVLVVTVLAALSTSLAETTLPFALGDKDQPEPAWVAVWLLTPVVVFVYRELSGRGWPILLALLPSAVLVPAPAAYPDSDTSYVDLGVFAIWTPDLGDYDVWYIAVWLVAAATLGVGWLVRRLDRGRAGASATVSPGPGLRRPAPAAGAHPAVRPLLRVGVILAAIATPAFCQLVTMLHHDIAVYNDVPAEKPAVWMIGGSAAVVVGAVVWAVWRHRHSGFRSIWIAMALMIVVVGVGYAIPLSQTALPGSWSIGSEPAWAALWLVVPALVVAYHRLTAQTWPLLLALGVSVSLEVADTRGPVMLWPVLFMLALVAAVMGAGWFLDRRTARTAAVGTPIGWRLPVLVALLGALLGASSLLLTYHDLSGIPMMMFVFAAGLRFTMWVTERRTVGQSTGSSLFSSNGVTWRR